MTTRTRPSIRTRKRTIPPSPPTKSRRRKSQRTRSRTTRRQTTARRRRTNRRKNRRTRRKRTIALSPRPMWISISTASKRGLWSCRRRGATTPTCSQSRASFSIVASLAPARGTRRTRSSTSISPNAKRRRCSMMPTRSRRPLTARRCSSAARTSSRFSTSRRARSSRSPW